MTQLQKADVRQTSEKIGKTQKFFFFPSEVQSWKKYRFTFMYELFQHRSIIFSLIEDLSRMSVIRYLCVRLLIFTCVCPLTERVELCVWLYSIMSLSFFNVWLHIVNCA